MTYGINQRMASTVALVRAGGTTSLSRGGQRSARAPPPHQRVRLNVACGAAHGAEMTIAFSEEARAWQAQ